MTVTHTSFRARRRRLAAALAIGFLVAGTGTTALADETPSPEPSASAEASPEAGAGQQAGQAPAGQGQAGQADQQAAPGAAAQEANGFKADNPGWANATKHTGEAHGVDENYTARWTRADAMQIQRVSNPNAPSGTNSMPEQLTMPEISNGFPATSEDVWVWDTWTLTDEAAHQISYNGWEIAFSLVADRHAGYTFDDRHTHARLGFFYRKAGTQTSSADGAGSSIGGNKDGNPVRGGSLSPTVKLNISGDTTSVDRTYGTNGLGGFADIPADRARTNGGDTRPQRLK